MGGALFDQKIGGALFCEPKLCNPKLWNPELWNPNRRVNVKDGGIAALGD